MGKVADYFEEHGPSTAFDGMGGIDYTARREGVWRFNPGMPSGRGVQDNDRPSAPARSPKAVYYIYQEHEPREILEAWIEANPRHFESLSQRAWTGMVNDHSKEWADTARGLWSRRRGDRYWSGTDMEKETTDYDDPLLNELKDDG